MEMWGFVLYSVLLGIGLATDAFSVSIADGMKWPDMKLSRAVLIAGTFAVFQALMPMSGWMLTHIMLEHFDWLYQMLPWVSKGFLLYMGIKMLAESRGETARPETAQLTACTLLLQAVATSVDALLIGLVFASFDRFHPGLCSLIIAAVTFPLCLLGVHWGRLLGLRLARQSSVLGGCVLILIALIN